MRKYLVALAAMSLLLACTPNNPDELTVTGDVLDITAYTATITGYANLPFELGDAEVGIMYDKNPSFEDCKKVVATELDGNNKFTVIAIGLDPGTTYFYKSYVLNGMYIKYGAVKSFTTQASQCPEGAADLGIVMTREDGSTYKLYWAKSNLCESGLCANPEDYGDYYAWGETEPYYTEGHSLDHPCSSWRTRTDHPITGYNWISYKFQASGELNENVEFSKYGPMDNITELQRGEKDGETVDDVARAKLDGRWRMPTDAEWTALRGLKWDWTTKNGINGCQVTATNGNSIFLPAAGSRFGSSLGDFRYGGHYWSSSLNTDESEDGWYVNFVSGAVYRYSGNRCYGRSVRPVSE